MGAVAVLWLRRTMDESEQFSNIKSQKRESAGTVRALMKHPKAVLTVVGLTLGGTVAFYTYTTYLQKFMVNTVGLPKEVVSRINFVALLIFVVLQPIAGLLSDKNWTPPTINGIRYSRNITNSTDLLLHGKNDRTNRSIFTHDGRSHYRYWLHIN